MVGAYGLQSDGLELAAEVYIPAGDRLCPALCICHGIPAVPYNPEDRGYPELAQKFCAAGFITLIFNFFRYSLISSILPLFLVAKNISNISI